MKSWWIHWNEKCCNFARKEDGPLNTEDPTTGALLICLIFFFPRRPKIQWQQSHSLWESQEAYVLTGVSTKYSICFSWGSLLCLKLMFLLKRRILAPCTKIALPHVSSHKFRCKVRSSCHVCGKKYWDARSQVVLPSHHGFGAEKGLDNKLFNLLKSSKVSPNSDEGAFLSTFFLLVSSPSMIPTCSTLVINFPYLS